VSTKLQYAYRWGVKQVNPFVEKYSRGTDYLAELLEIDRNQIRHLLTLLICSGNSVKWEAVKLLIKRSDREPIEPLSYYSADEKKALYMRLRGICEGDVIYNSSSLFWLDSDRNLVENLEGHEFRGGF